MTEVADSTLASRSRASIATSDGSRYLQQLCKHFRHKLAADFDEHEGRVTFPIGEVRLEADAVTLTITLTTADDERLAQLQDIVVRHLVRFAFREELTIDWVR